MESIRKPTQAEERLLEFLLSKASVRISPQWKDKLLVSPMNDGGMGSLYLFPDGEINRNRKMGKRISEHQFTDEDNVEVIASLNVDENDDLLELDIWKTDFNALIKFPEV